MPRSASLYACHWKTYYNFCLLTHRNSNKSDVTPYRSAISVNLVSHQLRKYLLATAVYKPLLMKNKCKMASMLKKISLSGDISITKRSYATNFYQFSLFIKTYLLVALP